MIDYKSLKIIAYDFDDTLFAHSNHKTETIGEEIDYVKSIYGHYLENWCMCSQEKKTIMLKALAESYNCNASNILIIDDNPLVVTMAADAGFQSATPIEIVNYCELNNI